jgi:hypothetical protein
VESDPAWFTTVREALKETGVSEATDTPSSRTWAAAYSTSKSHLAAQLVTECTHHPPGAPLGTHAATSAMSPAGAPGTAEFASGRSVPSDLCAKPFTFIN